MTKILQITFDCQITLKRKGRWTDSDGGVCGSDEICITGTLWWNMD